MKILIIEDEISASKRLTNMIKKADSSFEIEAVLDSIEDTVEWFNTNKEPDLVFADIQLSDGDCFQIFRQVKVTAPVIFTTAYDEYAIEAFKVNSIDYLLKPIESKALDAAIKKFKSLRATYSTPDNSLETLLAQLSKKSSPEYKSRFLVKKGQTMKTVPSSEAAYFVIESQLVFLVDTDGNRFVIENTMEELESMLDPKLFFRINRQMIVSLQAVVTIHPYFNSRLKLTLSPEIKTEILVSRQKVSEFKKWLDD